MAGYARLSNGFWQDKDILKLRRMNPSAALLYVMAISWCSDHASDGIIADDELLYVLNAVGRGRRRPRGLRTAARGAATRAAT